MLSINKWSVHYYEIYSHDFNGIHKYVLDSKRENDIASKREEISSFNLPAKGENFEKELTYVQRIEF